MAAFPHRNPTLWRWGRIDAAALLILLSALAGGGIATAPDISSARRALAVLACVGLCGGAYLTWFVQRISRRGRVALGLLFVVGLAAFLISVR